MEKQVEKIKTEYCLYEPEEPESIDSVYDVIIRGIDEVVYYKNIFEDERKKNKIRQTISRRLGPIARRVGFLRPEIYETDDRFIDVQERILASYYEQITGAIRDIDEDNYRDINKLALFARKKYLANNASVEEQRKISELSAAGIPLDRTLADEDSAAMNVFFNETLDSIVSMKVNAHQKCKNDDNK